MKKIVAVITHKRNTNLFKVIDIGAYNVEQINKFVSAYSENKYFKLDIRISNE